jgi:hypothetical protein
LEISRRELEAAHPHPVKPVCGCGHDLAFHNIEANTCHHPVEEKTCPCQQYTGPELLGQVYIPMLSDPEDRAS